MAGQLREPPEQELEIEIPTTAIKTLASESPDPQKNTAHGKSTRGKAEAEVEAGVIIKKEVEETAAVVAAKPRAKSTDEQGFRYQPIIIEIEYTIEKFNDGLHFVGWELDGERYPHLYTTNSSLPGSACCLFPCLDDFTSRCSWDISIRCPRTLGDALQSIHNASSATSEIKSPANPQLEIPIQTASRSFINRAAFGKNSKQPDKTIMLEVMEAMYPNLRETVREHDDASPPTNHEVTILGEDFKEDPEQDPPKEDSKEDPEEDSLMLSDEDKARDMTVVCSGELIEEVSSNYP